MTTDVPILVNAILTTRECQNDIRSPLQDINALLKEFWGYQVIMVRPLEILPTCLLDTFIVISSYPCVPHVLDNRDSLIFSELIANSHCVIVRLIINYNELKILKGLR